MTPALYECVITHTRTEPVRSVFTHRTYLWLVDLDHVPSHGPLARFLGRDHGDGGGLRDDLNAFLAGHGIAPPGRVLMLCHARVLGHVFNPLTVFWCRAQDGSPLCTVAEVHNTYGGRHRYLLHPDARGRAQAPKEFYVSPFLPVDGHYRLSLPEPDGRLRLSVALHLPDAPPFTASVRGTGRPATLGALLAAFLRHPVAPLVGAIRIRTRGIGLWARGVPVVPRCPHGPSVPDTTSRDTIRRAP
ncbi:DUF1365 domain-containing protein [Actinocorallia sp. A-T 12471]|uniref:DUF1365 domain-containing protein n=1 Tax=Actinocorallia sp. A-T 12471 TaxID=3089813 RepID=UPI0029CF1727|nr:DUF1365 domain-containing protein [Actinocorallia sp. A-T 12471]MDX6740344.1 DUF1365 domain-containing protein [Actinocorallia sp. A-T 12471]